MTKTIWMVLVLLPALLAGQSKFNQFKAQKYVIEGAKKLYKKQYDAALEDFEIAIKLDPYNRDVYQFRGEAHYQLDQFEASLDDFDQAIRIHDDVPELYYKRGLVYENMGYYNQASRDYRYSLTLNPQYSLAQRRIRRLDRKYDEDLDDNYYSDSGYPDRGEGTNDPDRKNEEVDDRYWWQRDRDSKSMNVVYEGDNIYVQDAPENMSIRKIELTPYVTRVELQVVNRDRTTLRFYLDPPLSRSSLFITDREMNEVYHITNIIRGKWGDTEIRPGGKTTFVLEFERIPDDLRFLHMRSGDATTDHAINFYGIILKK